MAMAPLDRPLRTVLFDVGNTLTYVDLDRVGGILARRGLQRDLTRLRAAEGRARAAMYSAHRESPHARDAGRWGLYVNAFFAELGLADPALRRELGDELIRIDRRENLWCQVPPEVAPLLGELRRRGFRLGVVSNSDGRVERLLRDVGLVEQFQVIVDSSVVGVEKPDPRIFTIALERLAEEPERAAYVGDFPDVDVVGARAAGLVAILLDPFGLGETDGADCVIHRLDDLARVLPARASEG
jgi:HAD superfamily hydrolase (TIGR01509 family)